MKGSLLWVGVAKNYYEFYFSFFVLKNPKQIKAFVTVYSRATSKEEKSFISEKLKMMSAKCEGGKLD